MSTTTPPVRAQRWQLRTPAGLDDWRAAQQLDADRAPTREQALAVLAGVRAHLERDEVARAADVPTSVAMDVVAGAGARAGQANKRGPRAAACLSFARGQASGMVPGVHEAPEGLVVVLADGWARTRLEARDVSRSYAAAVLASPEAVDAAVDRWLASVTGTGDVTYQHLAHLYSVARGTFATMTGVTADIRVQATYVAAFDMLEAAIRRACLHLRTLLAPGTEPASVAEAAAGCRWLLGRVADTVVELASAAAEGRGDTVPLDRALQRLRAEHAQRGLVPWSLENLSRTQFRALVTILGFPVPDDDEGTHEGTGDRALAMALARAARENAQSTAGELVLPGRADGVMRVLAPAGAC